MFVIELSWNICANWFTPFITDPWNLFDSFVVAISILSIALSGSGSFNLLRLFRVFRVLPFRCSSLLSCCHVMLLTFLWMGFGAFFSLRGQVIRIFRRLKRLKQIINALTASLIPVGNSFLVMGLVTSIYAVPAPYLTLLD